MPAGYAGTQRSPIIAQDLCHSPRQFCRILVSITAGHRLGERRPQPIHSGGVAGPPVGGAGRGIRAQLGEAGGESGVGQPIEVPPGAGERRAACVAIGGQQGGFGGRIEGEVMAQRRQAPGEIGAGGQGMAVQAAQRQGRHRHPPRVVAPFVGAQAGELITAWTLAIAQKLNIRAMTGVIMPYPTLSEIGKRAAIDYFTPSLTKPLLRRIVRWLRIFG